MNKLDITYDYKALDIFLLLLYYDYRRLNMNNDKVLKYLYTKGISKDLLEYIDDILYNNYEAGFNVGFDKGFEKGKQHAKNLIDLGFVHTL